MWIIKQDSLGKKQWERSLGGTGDEVLVDLKATPDGGYILTGFSTSDVSGDKTSPGKGRYDYCVVKVDNLGKVQWDKSLGGSYDDLGESIDHTTDGGYIVAGVTTSPASGDITESLSGVSDVWMVKPDASGNIQWQNSLGGNSADGYILSPVDPVYGKNFRLAICRQAPDGGYLMATFSNSGISGDKTTIKRGLNDCWVIKTDNAGNVVWDKTIGGTNNDYALDVKQDSPNSYIVSGEDYSGVSGNKTEVNYGSGDCWGVRLEESGTTTSEVNTSKLSSNETANTKAFLVYPNPATTVLHIQNVGKATFVLSDQAGKRMLSKTIEGNGDLNIASVPAGTYYLTNTTTHATQKVVITR